MTGQNSWHCCCGCWIFEDDFTAANSTTVSGWNEVTGDWEILNNRLHEKVGGGGTANAKIICNSALPDRSKGEMYLVVSVIDPSTNDVFYLYPACMTTIAIGDIVAIFTYLGGLEWNVDVTLSGVSQDSIQMTSAPIVAGVHRLWVCVDQEYGMVKAGITSVGDEYVWVEADPGQGQYFGLGHNNAATGATFDDVYVTEMRKGTVVCSGCFCWCLGAAPGRTLTARFLDATGRASCLNGYSWTMEPDWWTNSFTWLGSVTVAATSDGGLSTEMEFRLTCASGNDDDSDWPGRNFLLDFENNMCCTTNSNACGTYQPIAEESTCSPFSLVFGPFQLRCDDLTCWLCWPPLEPGIDPPPLGIPTCDTNDPNFSGEYYIIITETVP